MSRLVDVNGVPFDRVARAMSDMERRVNEAIFGGGADERVRMLIESVTGEVQPRQQLRGLAACLDAKPDTVHSAD